jgi:hypothetical protein
MVIKKEEKKNREETERKNKEETVEGKNIKTE